MISACFMQFFRFFGRIYFLFLFLSIGGHVLFTYFIVFIFRLFHEAKLKKKKKNGSHVLKSNLFAHARGFDADKHPYSCCLRKQNKIVGNYAFELRRSATNNNTLGDVVLFDRICVLCVCFELISTSCDMRQFSAEPVLSAGGAVTQSVLNTKRVTSICVPSSCTHSCLNKKK